MNIVKGVGIALWDKQDNMLLVEENQTKIWKQKGDISMPLWWIDHEEFAKEAALREIHEETGSALSDCLYLGQTSFVMPEIDFRADVELFGALVESLDPALQFQSDEIADVFSIDYEQFLAMVESGRKGIRPGNMEILSYLSRYGDSLKNRLSAFGTQRLG